MQASDLDPLQQYATFPFSSDDEYSQGLASVIANGALDSTADEIVREDIIRRTRVFYFNRVTGNSITIEQAREIELQDNPQTYESGASEPVSNQGEQEPVVLSFAQIQDLIESGKMDQIPNNKFIPNVLNDASPSESTAQPKRKPWENTAAS